MTLNYLEKKVIESFCNLNTFPLKNIDEKVEYSYDDKDEFIDGLNSTIEKIKLQGIINLIAKPSRCKYCYPSANAYSFHHPKTDEFIIRYVFHQESESVFRVEECKNIPPRADGMPF